MTVLEGQAAPKPRQTRWRWRRRCAEAVVQQSFMVRMDCTRFGLFFFDAKWNMTQSVHRTEALSGAQPAEAPSPPCLWQEAAQQPPPSPLCHPHWCKAGTVPCHFPAAPRERQKRSGKEANANGKQTQHCSCSQNPVCFTGQQVKVHSGGWR